MSARKKLKFQDEDTDVPSPKTPTKRLTVKEIDILTRDYETTSGTTQRSLAAKYKVSKSQVNRALLKRGIAIRKEVDDEKKPSGSGFTTENPTTKDSELSPNSTSSDKTAKKSKPNALKSKTKSRNEVTVAAGINKQLPPNCSKSTSKIEDSESGDNDSLESFDNMDDLENFFDSAKKTNENGSMDNNDQNLSQITDSTVNQSVIKNNEFEAKKSGTTKEENERDTSATDETSRDRLEHEDFKEYANWYVRYNINEREKWDRKYKFLVGEYQAATSKSKRLERELEKKDETILDLTHQNKRLKRDYEDAVNRENDTSQKYKNLLEDMKHKSKFNECFVKGCKYAPTAKFKSLSFCSLQCAEKTFTVKAIDTQPI